MKDIIFYERSPSWHARRPTKREPTHGSEVPENDIRRITTHRLSQVVKRRVDKIIAFRNHTAKLPIAVLLVSPAVCHFGKQRASFGTTTIPSLGVSESMEVKITVTMEHNTPNFSTVKTMSTRATTELTTRSTSPSTFVATGCRKNGLS
jgi:hypothetical protein